MTAPPNGNGFFIEMKKINEVKRFKVGKTYKGVGEVRGIDFTLVRRMGYKALFLRSDGYYEVIELKSQESETVNIRGREVHIKEREVYPTGESWQGKCLRDKDRALKHFEAL